MSNNPSPKSRPLDPESLELLLDVELACTYVLQSSTPSFPRGSRRGGTPSHEALDEIVKRIAASMAQLLATCDGAHDLLGRAEWDAVKALVRSDARAAGQAAARRVLLTAVPRLFFGTQALICEGRAPWQREGGGSRPPARPSGSSTTGLRTRVA